MALDWVAGALGATIGTSTSYVDGKKEQRKWNMDQAAKQADMERAMHFKDLERQKTQTFNEQNAGKVEVAGAKRLAAHQASPDQIAHRKMMGNEKIQSAKDIKTAELGIESAQKKQLIKDQNAEIDAMADLSAEEKSSLKQQNRLSAMGLSIPGATKLKPSDYIDANKASVDAFKDIDDGQIVKTLTDMGLTEGRDFTKNTARTVAQDLHTAKQLAAYTQQQGGGQGSKLTLESADAKLSELPPQDQQAAIDQLAGKLPEEAIAQLKAKYPAKTAGVMDGKTMVDPYAAGNLPIGTPTSTGRKFSDVFKDPRVGTSYE